MSRIKSFVNYAFFREYRYRRVVRRHLAKYYSGEAAGSTYDGNLVVCMADGKYLHGGLADRLRSFATFYGYCKAHDIRFAINFNFPFELEEYLVPNEYDWHLRQGELSFNCNESHAVYMDNTADTGAEELRYQRRITDKFLKDKRYKQHHVYSSFYYDEDNFAENFNQLFKPSPRVEAELDKHLKHLGDKYISVSTRFLELLGDFKEPKGGVTLNNADAESLIARCVEQLSRLHSRFPEHRVFVTSDSGRFLSAAKSLPFVYVVDGEIKHVDVAGDCDHLKTFLDFLLIGRADRVYQLQTTPMYGGNFSLRAAQAGGRPYERIMF